MRMHAGRGLFFLALVAACGDGENPAAPTSVTTATSLTIVGPAGFSSGSTLTIGQTVSLRASLDLSDGTRRDVDAEWQSSNTTIATVDQSGMVTARAAGVFDVSASAEGLSTRLTGLRVDPPENRPPTVTIETPSQTVDGGGTLQMRATARDPEGSIDRIRWTQTGGSFIDNTVEDAVWNVPVATSTDVAHRLRITVTDAAGATATDVVTITVRKVVVGEVGACRSGLTVDPRQWCTVGAAGRFEVEVGGRACLVDGVGNMVSRFCSSIRVEVRGFRANRIADSESWRVDAFDWNLYEANKSIWITALR